MPISIPPEQWSEWPAPNYDNPATKPRYALVFVCFLGPLSIALTSARLWIRILVQRNAGLDDWLMLASLVRKTPISSRNSLTWEASYDNC
ncbi:hypothetical protein GQ44DRAFT_609764 [Phaeosphaeriaceae sp. PMI808]|nr:hypothetical protein GQ44DRAFT_609764 [Phaeosphaeriaceae sp. PMI808]